MGIFLSSYTENLGTYLFLYCFLNGIGCGTCYFVVLICAWEWFPDRKGLVTGLTLGGYGFGSFIFARVSTKLVNPDSKNPSIYVEANDVTYYERDVADRVPFMIRSLVYIWSALVLIAIILINRKPLETDED